MSVKEISTDVFVIGGGINGAGIARDLAGRGLSVVLCEQGDLASATSSASSKIIHGGLRYLEQKDFKLVRESLMEREVLLRSAPHLISPMDFVLPHDKSQRPYWLIRLGVFLYDHLAPRDILPGSEGLNLTKHETGKPLKSDYKRGILYSDCWADDARLVVVNAIDASEKGAKIFTRLKCKSVRKKRGSQIWRATCEDQISKREIFIDAKCVVNATGPWVGQVVDGIDKNLTDYKTRLVKGSHIIVPRLYEGAHAYTLQNDDGRVVFAMPYEGEFTLIGTTDVNYRGNPADASISKDEISYLCKAVNKFFKVTVEPKSVVSTYSGVRSLFDDGHDNASKVTRDYKLELKEHEGLPVLSVFGGKLTSYRKLAEQASNIVAERLGNESGPWTEFAVLPGGDITTVDFHMFFKTFKREFAWLPKEIAYRYCKSYGSRARFFLRGAKRLQDLGQHLGGGIYEAEIAYLVMKEWAMTPEDILTRRSKWGLHITDETKSNIEKTLRKYKNHFSTHTADSQFNQASS